jgi:hypothetical protein
MPRAGKGPEAVRKIFQTKKMALIASLPANDANLAAAAQAGGADMLKIHLNVRHAASGACFGSFDEERPRIEAVLAAVDIPVGIMPGAATAASARELETLAEMGIAFYDIYASDMPAEYLKVEDIEPMVALGPDWREWEPEKLSSLGAGLLEASIVKHEEYGKPLFASDLAAYSRIAATFAGAVVVPTQKAIKPDETGLLSRCGVRGLMIGKIVAGDSPTTFEKSAADFARAIGNL